MFNFNYPKNPPFPLIFYPQQEDILRQISQKVTQFDKTLDNFTQGMLKTMEINEGIGLAAPQVGVLKNIFVMSIAESYDGPKIFINPNILSKSSESIEYEEGCLSIPDIKATIKRSRKIKVEAQHSDGKTFQIEVEGLPAICIQHEIDHLNGVLFIDHLSYLKRTRIRKKMLQIK